MPTIVERPQSVRLERNGNIFSVSWQRVDGAKISTTTVTWKYERSDGKYVEVRSYKWLSDASGDSYTFPASSWFPIAWNVPKGGDMIKAIHVYLTNNGRGSTGTSKTVHVSLAYPNDAPTGLTVDRVGTNFTGSWETPKSGAASRVRVEWLVTTKDGKQKVLRNVVYSNLNTSEDTFVMPTSSYFPANGKSATDATTVKNVTLRVSYMNPRGAFSSSKSFTISNPDKPTVEFERNGSQVIASLAGESKLNKWATRLRYNYVLRDVGASTAAALQTPSSLAASRTITPINPAKAKEAVIDAWLEGLAGKSAVASYRRYISVPNKPYSMKVEKIAAGSYRVGWSYTTTGGYPVDSFRVVYCDCGYTETPPAIGTWQTAKEGISGSTRSVNTDLLGNVPNGKVRRFALIAEHDGNETASDAASYREYGKPDVASTAEISYVQTTSPSQIRASWVWPEGLPDGAEARIYIDGVNNYGTKKLVKSQLPESRADTFITNSKYTRNTHRIGVRITVEGSHSETVWSEWTDEPILKVSSVKAVSAKKTGDVTVSWGNTGEATTVEVAYSQHADAFTSNTQPDMLSFTADKVDGVGTMSSATVRGLEVGKAYYFWVRRSATGTDGVIVKTPWTRASVTVNGVLSNAEAELLATPLYNASLALSRSWVKQSEPTLQAAWSWVQDEGLQNLPKGSSIIMYKANDHSKAIRSWSFSGTQDGSSLTLRTAADKNLALGDYDLKVNVTNAAGSVSSVYSENGVEYGWQRVSIVAQPTAMLSIQNQSQYFTNYSFAPTAEQQADGLVAYSELRLRKPAPVFSCSGTNGARLVLSVRARDDYELDMPYGKARVHAGEVVYSAEIGAGSATASIAGAELMDGCIYEAVLVAIDDTSGLRSAEKVKTFRVNWERKAVEPVLTVNADGMAAVFSAERGTYAEESDSLDFYRVTVDGVYLIADGAEWETNYADAFAAYGWEGSAIRAACVTPYGSAAWVDVPCGIESTAARIDWEGGYLELPRMTSRQDDRKKTYSVKTYLGGSKRAYINGAIDRTQTLAADVEMREDSDAYRRVLELSRHEGTCFVRTPDGDAYAAVANVAIQREGRERSAASVTITAQETDLNGEYMAVRL